MKSTREKALQHYRMESVVNYRGNYDFKCPNCRNSIDDLMFSKHPTYCFKYSRPEESIEIAAKQIKTEN